MPITQDRMIALIHDAKRAEKAYLAFRQELRLALRSVSEGTFTEQEFYAVVGEMVSRMGDLPLLAVAVEESHFTKRAEANKKNKMQMRLARTGTTAGRTSMGLPPVERATLPAEVEASPKAPPEPQPGSGPRFSLQEVERRVAKVLAEEAKEGIKAQVAIDYATMPRFSPEDLLKPKGDRKGVTVEVEGGFPEISPDTDPTTLL